MKINKYEQIYFNLRFITLAISPDKPFCENQIGNPTGPAEHPIEVLKLVSSGETDAELYTNSYCCKGQRKAAKYPFFVRFVVGTFDGTECASSGVHPE